MIRAYDTLAANAAELNELAGEVGGTRGEALMDDCAAMVRRSACIILLHNRCCCCWIPDTWTGSEGGRTQGHGFGVRHGLLRKALST